MSDAPDPKGIFAKLIELFVYNRLLVAIFIALLLMAGLMVQPFDQVANTLKQTVPSVFGALPRARVAVDAIPDIGENQQIVFTRWPGRSPKDIEDQVTYPLTAQLLGLSGVKTVRSSSMFGFSSIYVIFEEGTEFYWSRTRILEKLNALPRDLLPEGVQPKLGPDATALGQVFWYTLEGRDPKTGKVVGGWDLHELRTVQDWTVRYGLQAASGVSEVASVGGHVMTYQIDVDPKKLAANQISLHAVTRAVKDANKDIGARTMEINRVEYILRGVGQVKSTEDLEKVVVAHRQDRPLLLGEVARIHMGPAQRRGALDVGGAEAVGGVVVSRYGANPVEVIEAVKKKMALLQPSLPRRTLDNGQVSQVTIVPFYDRSEIVQETLQTLSDALIQQILITILVVIVLLGNLRSSMVISLTLPLAVLGAFGLMKLSGVTANVMSLAGIAIAIGTMVDLGIVLTENMSQHLEDAAQDSKSRLHALWIGASEVAPAVATSVATTILSFLPVFGLTAAEGKLFHPLAFTKTFALLMALVLAVVVIPSLAAWLMWPVVNRDLAKKSKFWFLSVTHLRDWVLVVGGVVLMVYGLPWAAILVILMGVIRLCQAKLSPVLAERLPWIENIWAIVGVVWLLAQVWMPLGQGVSFGQNLTLVAGVCLGLLLIFWVFLQVYKPLLIWMLDHKMIFLSVPLTVILLGSSAWLGFDTVFGWLPQGVQKHQKVKRLSKALPGFEREFMPAFDEGQFLYMPTVMPHASFGQALDQLKLMDASISQIPEVEDVVGKLGRVDSALDPAPISMFETVITYKKEWHVDDQGKRTRQWRDHIKTTEDIWQEVVKATKLPGLTSAPKLMPINTRIVMLQSGMRAPMGIRIKGADLASLEAAGQALESVLKKSAVVRQETVFAERVVGKPYLELLINREAIARYGLSVEDVQRTLQVAVGGIPLTRVNKGRVRFDVRVRYERGARMSPEALEALLVPTKDGKTVPLSQVASLQYVKGPQVIKSEDTFLTSSVIFDIKPGTSEVEAVRLLQRWIGQSIDAKLIALPEGVSYEFAGNYKNQVRSEARLKLLIPIALLLVFVVLYLQFRDVSTSLMIYSGVAVAVGGGFILMWLCQQSWFLDVTLFNINVRHIFQIRGYNMSVAVWVGVIALVGIATDDGVVMATYLKQQFAQHAPDSIEAIREHVLASGLRRARPCLMTTATTILALLPVMTSTGRGGDVMVPMAIPCIGGMGFALITLFVVPVLYCWREETRFKILARQVELTMNDV